MAKKHTYEPMPVSEKRAQLRRWMQTPGSRLSLKAQKSAALFGYKDGTLDVVITESWHGDDEPCFHQVGIAVCPIVLEEKKAMRELWANSVVNRTYKNMAVVALKTTVIPGSGAALDKKREAVAAKCRRYIGALLRRKDCIHRQNLTMVQVRRPFGKLKPPTDDFEA